MYSTRSHQRKWPESPLLPLTLWLVGLLSTTSVEAFATNQYISGIKLSGNRIEDQTLFPEIKSTLGGRIELPCNLTLPSDDDAIQLIFWYRGNGTRAPIYTLDARASLANATHFPVDSRFDFRVAQPLATLVIDPILEQDHGDYRCRVDFRWGRTINSFVSLHIIVPPKQVVIKDAVSGLEFGPKAIAGPYNEGTDVRLTCESLGGIPPPTLHWFHAGAMIDGSYAVGVNGSVWNELTIYRVGSVNIGDEYVCQAGNFNSSTTPPTNNIVEASVRLDINVMPTTVRILSKNDSNRLAEGRRLELRCQTYGSRPAASIKWLKNGVVIFNGVSEHREPNITTSTLIMSSVDRRDNAAEIECRASNPSLTAQFIRDSITLQVFYKPHVEIDVRVASNETSLASSTSSSSPTSPIKSEPVNPIRLLVGVRAEVRCRIQSHPAPIAVQIFHNNRLLDQIERFDASRDAIAGYRLVIGSVNSSHSGRYECLAKNREGSTRSNALAFDVQYIPHCDTLTPVQYSLALNESIVLKCPVQANPLSTTFHWSWHEDDSADFDSDKSEFKFTPHSEEDFGQLYCWARNALGEQEKRCHFTISRARPPESLVECRAANRTTTSFAVECDLDDEDPIEKLTFHALLLVPPKPEVHDEEKILQNVTSKQNCQFQLNNLTPGTAYIIELWASNRRGTSARTHLAVDTMRTHNTKLISHSSSLQEIEVDPLYSAFFGAAVFGLGAVIVASFVSCRARRNRLARQEREEAEQIKQNFAFRTMSTVDCLNSDNKNNNKADQVEQLQMQYQQHQQQQQQQQQTPARTAAITGGVITPGRMAGSTHPSVGPSASLVQMALPNVLGGHPSLEHHHHTRHLLQPTSAADIVFDNYGPPNPESVFVIDNGTTTHSGPDVGGTEVSLQPFLISTADGAFHSLYSPSVHQTTAAAAAAAAATPYQLAPAGSLFQLEQHHIEPTIIYHTIAQHYTPYATDTTPTPPPQLQTTSSAVVEATLAELSRQQEHQSEDVKQSTV